jgi:TPR repeat protein
MKARISQPFWVGALLFNMLSSAALADEPPATPLTSAALSDMKVPEDPKKIAEKAQAALNDEDLVTAMKLFYQAALQNYIPAQVQMGQFAQSAETYEEAAGWYLTAAMQGDARGQFYLSGLYVGGLGIENDPAKALYWTRRSAAQDYLPAVKAMARAYRMGGYSGQVKVDLDQAKLWDSKVARLVAIERSENLKNVAEYKKQLREAAIKANEAKKAAATGK